MLFPAVAFRKSPLTRLLPPSLSSPSSSSSSSTRDLGSRCPICNAFIKHKRNLKEHIAYKFASCVECHSNGIELLKCTNVLIMVRLLLQHCQHYSSSKPLQPPVVPLLRTLVHHHHHHHHHRPHKHNIHDYLNMQMYIGFAIIFHSQTLTAKGVNYFLFIVH